METFNNLIPALAKAHYFKENNAAKDEGIVSYSNADLGFPAIVDLNHDTGDVVFTYGQSQIMPIKLERLKIIMLTSMLTLCLMNLRTLTILHAPLSEHYPLLTHSVQTIARKGFLWLTLVPTS